VLWVQLAVSAIVSEVRLAVLTMVERRLWPLSTALTAVTWQCHGMRASLAVTWPVVVLGGGWKWCGTSLI
jgi:hypothetical protein